MRPADPGRSLAQYAIAARRTACSHGSTSLAESKVAKVEEPKARASGKRSRSSRSFRCVSRDKMADDHASAAPLKLHHPSPLAAEVAFSPPSSSSLAPSSHTSMQHERTHAAAQRTEAEEDADELRNFRELALQRQRAMGGGSQSSSFEPFVGSRVGSPIPDKHGLGWPGACCEPWPRGSDGFAELPLRFVVLQARARSTASTRLPRRLQPAKRSSRTRSRSCSNASARTRSATACSRRRSGTQRRCCG